MLNIFKFKVKTYEISEKFNLLVKIHKKYDKMHVTLTFAFWYLFFIYEPLIFTIFKCILKNLGFSK